MRKFIHVLLFGAAIVAFSAAHSYSIPKEIIKKGTKLVYDVNYEGNYYEITVVVKDNSEDYHFDWYMSAPAIGKGSLNLSKNAIENATGILSNFTNGELNLADQCCIVMSKKMYEAFNDKGSMEIYTDKKNNILTIFGNPYTHTQNFGYMNDFSSEFNCKTVSDGGSNQITYVNDPNFPLIVELKLDWSLKLKSIYN